MVQERSATERERTRREMRRNSFTISIRLTRWVRSCQGTCLFHFSSVYCGLIDPQRTHFCQICSISANMYQAVTRVNHCKVFKVQETLMKVTIFLWTPCFSLSLKFILFFLFYRLRRWVSLAPETDFAISQNPPLLAVYYNFLSFLHLFGCACASIGEVLV